jgi:NAD(P)-dependent dehydrogenase (short-subunit alcohol dehydrogenase family)
MSNTDRRVALVTGASTGIGRATAKALLNAGYRVFGTSRRPAAANPDGITMLACDVTDEASVAKLVDQVLAEAGRIDLLVNNAGIGMLGGAEESSAAQVQALFDVNLFGVIRMTNKVLPSMRQQGRGRVINISSILGVVPAPYSAHYSASKHALEGYSESLDHETRAFNIRVSLIQPAYTRSSFDQNSIDPDLTLREYDQARASVGALVKKALATADFPEVVGDVVVKAAADPKPRHRYTAGKVARQISILRRFVPASMFDKTLRKQFQLPV